MLVRHRVFGGGKAAVIAIKWQLDEECTQHRETS
jgi:hypothetical protein